MITVTLNPDLKSFLDHLEKTVSQIPGIPALRVTIMGKMVRLLYCQAETNNTICDICIEPENANTPLSFLQINQIGKFLSEKLQTPTPKEMWQDNYHARLEWQGKTYHINVEYTQKEPQSSLDCKVNIEGKYIFSTTFNFEGKTQEELFKDNINAIPNLSLVIMEYERTMFYANGKVYPAHLAFLLKSSIKPVLRENYQLSTYVGFAWSVFINDNYKFYTQLKQFLKNKPSNDITEEEFDAFEAKVHDIKRQTEKDSNKQHYHLLKDYLKQPEIIDKNNEKKGLFYRLMTVYNFYIDEKNETEQACLDAGEMESYILLREQLQFFGIPEVLFLLDRSSLEFEKIKEKIKIATEKIENERLQLKKIIKDIAAKKQSEAELAAKKEQERKLKQKAPASVVASSSKGNVNTPYVPSKSDEENAIVNQALKNFTQVFLKVLLEWGKKANTNNQVELYLAISKGFYKEYHQTLTTLDLKAKFFAGIKSHILSDQGEIAKLPHAIRFSVLQSILLYMNVNVETYIAKKNNLRALLANMFDCMRYYRFLFPDIEPIPAAANVQALVIKSLNKNACDATAVYIRSFFYSHDAKIEQILSAEFKVMQAEDVFNHNDQLREISKKGENPGRDVSFRFTDDNVLIDSDCLRLFYEDEKHRLKNFMKEDPSAIFITIMRRYIFEGLNDQLYMRPEGALSFDKCNQTLERYIKKLGADNKGDNGKIIALENKYALFKKTSQTFYDKIYNRASMISTDFTRYRIISGIFDVANSQDQEAVIESAIPRYQDYCKENNIKCPQDIKLVDCLIYDNINLQYLKVFINYINLLVKTYPQIYTPNLYFQQLQGVQQILGATDKYFDRVIDILLHIPINDRHKYNKVLDASLLLKEKLPQSWQWFWFMIDVIHLDLEYRSILQTAKTFIEQFVKDFQHAATHKNDAQMTADNHPTLIYGNATQDYKNKKYNDALDKLNQAMTLYIQYQVNPLQIAVCLSTMASCYRNLNQSKDALTSCVKALSLCRVYKLEPNDTKSFHTKFNEIHIVYQKTKVNDYAALP